MKIPIWMFVSFMLLAPLGLWGLYLLWEFWRGFRKGWF